ncbi:methyltransferase [Spirochaetia bacterium]|nr:methyltransferase [Spirochaetia bacterium]GHV92568.1 methyltransferase [Spirochaetia bacterium]
MGTPITEIDIVIRLALGFLAGAVIGFERASRRQVAGMRTHALISTGATLLMLLSIWLPQEYIGLKNGDPGRIAAQVVSGIGFLGAGAIIRLGNNIRGLTTAASLWLIAAVGMAIGAGMFIAAGAAEVISLITLIVLDKFERRLFPSVRNKMLELHYKNTSPSAQEALDVLRGFGIRTQSIDVVQSTGKGKEGKAGKEGKSSKLRLMVSIPDATDLSKLAKALKAAGEVSRIEIKEKY